MKAVQINKYGGSEVIEINNNAPKPVLLEGYVLVKVHSASLNRIDSVIRGGYVKEMLPLEFPITLGGDFSGVIDEKDKGINDFNIGDEVYGNAGVFKGGSGSLAEFVLVKSSNMGLKPMSLSFDESAALPLAAASALQGIEEHIQLKAGEKILIHGGSGGVGSIAVQLAKLHDAYVTVTVSTKDIDTAQQLGADEIIDYKKQDFSQLIKNYDAVFDTTGSEAVSKSYEVLKKGGVLVTIAGQPDKEMAEKHQVKAISQLTNVNHCPAKKNSGIN